MQYLTVTVLSMLQQQAQRQVKWVSRHQFAPSPAATAGTKAGKVSVKTSICPLPSSTCHHSTVECRPAELDRFESIFWCESNRIKIIFGELECTSQQHRAVKLAKLKCVRFSAWVPPFPFHRSCTGKTWLHCLRVHEISTVGGRAWDRPQMRESRA